MLPPDPLTPEEIELVKAEVPVMLAFQHVLEVTGKVKAYCLPQAKGEKAAILTGAAVILDLILSPSQVGTIPPRVASLAGFKQQILPRLRGNRDLAQDEDRDRHDAAILWLTEATPYQIWRRMTDEASSSLEADRALVEGLLTRVRVARCGFTVPEESWGGSPLGG